MGHVVEVDSDELILLRSKAESYDEISEKIGSFYSDDDGNPPPEEEGDLLTMGEWIATYFGYL